MQKYATHTREIPNTNPLFCKFFIDVLEIAFAAAKGAAIKFAGRARCSDSSFLRADKSEIGSVSDPTQSQLCFSEASETESTSERVLDPDTITTE